VRELHQDGTFHLHVLLCFHRKLHLRSATALDVKGFHCNIGPARDVKACYNYMRKAPQLSFESGDKPSALEPKENSWRDLVELAGDRPRFWRAIRERHPRDYVLQRERLEQFLERESALLPRKDYGGGYAGTDWNVPAELTDWLFEDTDRPRSLVMVGGSRLGKTTWARTLGKHMYFNTMIDLAEWRDDAWYAIFDDFEFQFIPNKKCFFGAQQEFAITDKYRKKMTVRWGKPSIFLFNELPSELSSDWYQQNCVIVFINTALFL